MEGTACVTAWAIQNTDSPSDVTTVWKGEREKKLKVNHLKHLGTGVFFIALPRSWPFATNSRDTKFSEEM